MSKLSFVLSHYLIIGLLVFASYLLGRRLLLKLKFDSISEEISFSIALGMGLIAYLVLFIGLSEVLFPSVLLLVLLACLLVCYQIWIYWPHRLTTIWKQLTTLKNRHLVALVIVVALAIFAVLLPLWLLPLYPPTAWDSISYHLATAKIYAQSHVIQPTLYLRFPVFPQINQMLFTLMLLLYNDIAAQLVQFLMMLLVAVALYAWGLRVFSPRVGLWAAALWLGNPLVLWLGASAYVDIGLTLFVSLGVYAFFNWVSGRERAWLMLAGVFLGLAAGSKYAALFFLGIFGLAALHMGVRERRWSYPVVLGIVSTCVAAPWYLRNIYYTGNPVFPFFSQIFGYSFWSPYDLQGQLQEVTSHGTGETFFSLLLLPWNLTFNQILFHMEAPLSWIYFFTLPVLVLFGVKNIYIRGLLTIAIVYALFWFFSAQVLRYLVPALPILSLATAASLERFLLWLPLIGKRVKPILITAIGFALWISPGWLYAFEVVYQKGFMPVTQEQRDVYLAQRLPSYSAYQFLNELKGRDYRLYALYDENMAFFADGTFMGDWFGTARYSDIVSKLAEGHALYEELMALDANYFLVAKHRIRVDLPEDEFFNSHFKLIYASAYVLLFELTEKPLQRKVGQELLQNPGFEDLEGHWPSDWLRTGKPVVNAFGQYNYSGLVAVRSKGTGNVFYQTVPVKPGKLYLLSLHARAIEKGQKTRLQVNWSDAQGKLLNTDIEVIEVGSSWRHYEMAVTAPEQSTFAIIYASPHEHSSIWFDDFSFVEVKYGNE